MGTQSKYRRRSTKDADAKIAERKEKLHIPGYKWIHIVDDMKKKSHKRITIGWKRVV